MGTCVDSMAASLTTLTPTEQPTARNSANLCQRLKNETLALVALPLDIPRRTEFCAVGNPIVGGVV